ncbi:MAG: hypothetical protein ACLBM1_16675 [Cuspidothrix sp.]
MDINHAYINPILYVSTIFLMYSLLNPENATYLQNAISKDIFGNYP